MQTKKKYARGRKKICNEGSKYTVTLTFNLKKYHYEVSSTCYD
jgi:hypothetical protein